VEAALAAAEGARQTEQFAENAILNEVASACVRFEQARQARTLYHDGVLEPATRNLDVIRQTYAFGQKTLLDYLTEQRRYADLEADYTNVLKEYFDAMAAIQTATGTEVH
ncbi:MAG TPA: TolC family protein, partial [Blastocatellia bacterium]|nr:TolC family protein [Blastocatellia bacterium]